jgi:DNA polymerase-3 subunit delta'
VRAAELLGHGPVIEGLWRAARSDRLAHALGFFGPPGVGKFLAAERLVLGLVCRSGPGEPCLSCGPCKRALSDAHPDVLVLDPLEREIEEIPIAWITPRDEPDKDRRPPGGVALEEFLSLRPLEGGWRAVIVREADRLGHEAQNALLKTLEEPGADVLIVLESSSPDDLLPTVKSRLVPVAFGALAPEEVLSVLVGAGVARDEAAELARAGRGAPGRALRLREQGASDVLGLVARVASGSLDPLAAAAGIGELEGEFPGRTPSARARARSRAALDLVLETIGDALRARAGGPASRIAHRAAASACAALPEARLEAALERALEARQDVDKNLDPALAVERALLALAPAPRARSVRPR